MELQFYLGHGEMHKCLVDCEADKKPIYSCGHKIERVKKESINFGEANLRERKHIW